MFGQILTTLVSFLILQASPSVLWKAVVNQVEGNQYQLVVNGVVAPDYYVHPMADQYVGTQLEVEPGEGVSVSGDPIEEFTPSDYKGETVVTGTYVLKQNLVLTGSGKLTVSDQTLTLIPYYAWCHRGSGKMRVWLPQDLSATTPAQPATLASESKVTTSTPRMPAISSVNDRLVPKGENDRSVPYTHWWPKKASTEWIAYEFAQESEVSTSTVHWFSDKPWGGCAVPKSWRILYQRADGQWLPVEGADSYPTYPGTASTVNFTPVRTKAVRLEVTLPDNDSAGLFEWSVR